MKLIINAEDFGLSKSVNQGICEGLKQGFLTSASLFVNASFCEDAVKIIKENNFQNIGVHLNITFGFPVSPKEKVKSLVEPNGKFHYMCSMPFFAKYKDVKLELENQVQKFLGFGLTPSHLDFHHYFYASKDVLEAFFDVAKKHNLPVRTMTPKMTEMAKKRGLKTTDFFAEDFHSSFFHSVEDLSKISNFFKDKQGSVELMTTPGYVDEFTTSQTNFLAREDELFALKKAFENGTWKDFELCSFKDL